SSSNSTLAMSYLLPGGTSLPAASGPGAVISYQVPIISGNMTSANSTNLTADVAQGKRQGFLVRSHEYFGVGCFHI
ncbi:hypothetical protein RRG08_005224, partial [Elysia crispata]